jgi:hypothetical protein
MFTTTTKINEKGNRYGRLLVIKESPNRSKQNDVCWRCRCDCGNYTVVRGRSLRDGTTKSCGCYQRECAARAIRKLHKRPDIRKKVADGRRGKIRVYRPDGSWFFAKPAAKKRGIKNRRRD